MNFDSNVGSRLKEARELRGWTIANAANMIGVTAKTLIEWETGRRAPRVNRLMTAAGVLGVAVVWLINGDGTLDPNETSRSRLEKLENRLNMALNRANVLNSELRDIASEMRYIRKLDSQMDVLAEVESALPL